MTNPQLLRWMFKFLSPVKPLIFLACFYLATTVGLEILAVRQTGQAVDHIKHLTVNREVTNSGFWHWFWSGEGKWHGVGTVIREARTHDPQAPLRDVLMVLIVLTAVFLVCRYLRIVAETKLSMTMVFYIREAVYDKLQRVG